MEARGDLGNNRWLHVAERPLEEPPETERENEINTSLFWQLRRACVKGSQGAVITKLDPEAGAEYAHGREAWLALDKKLNTKAQATYQANHWSNKLTECIYTSKSTVSMAKHINDFNTYITEMESWKESLQ